MSAPEIQEAAQIFAHSLPDRPAREWEPLADHAQAVGSAAAGFAGAFGWGDLARVAGVLHDAGKCSAEFQAYLRAARDEAARRVDHSTAGARIAATRFKGEPGRLVAACIAGHHAGLPDPAELDRRLDPAHPIPAAPDWAKWLPPIPETGRPTRIPVVQQKAFWTAFLARMIFSCLVDADFLETERFMSGGAVQRGVGVPLRELRDALAEHMKQLETRAGDAGLNVLRASIRKHVLAKAESTPGLFTLTVPTGGGKTLASLGFALDHALRHGKRRVIYVIPFTSIIEQTASVFRDTLGRREAVLEHHASFDWERAARDVKDGGDERDGLGVLRRAAENWDVPIVVTTSVQFFESLFAARTSSCRKLHNIVDSVVILDEAQMLPTRLLLPCLAVLRELTANYGVSAVLCTATQPALRARDGALVDKAGRNLGLDICDDRELAPDPPKLYAQLKRVRVEVREGETEDDVIAARFAEAPRLLCIVNTRAHARELFDRIADLPGAAHLSTLMCPAHRSAVLADLRERLKRGEPVRLVSTSLIEAGVDISFPEVWRATSGVDSIAQAAGRCNREGEMLPERGRVVVFSPAGRPIPKSMRAFQAAARGVLRDHRDDPLALDAVRAYFRQLYFHKGVEALDAAEIGGRPGILRAIEDGANGFRYPFRSIAGAFRMIEDAMQPVVVPWNDEAKAALDRMAHAEKPSREDFRALQRFTVGIPKRARDEWLRVGAIVAARRELGDALLRFVDRSLYRRATGIDLANPTYRAADDNVC